MKKLFISSAAAAMILAVPAIADDVTIITQVSSGKNTAHIYQSPYCNCAFTSQIGEFNYMWLYQSAPHGLAIGSQTGSINGLTVVQVSQ